MRQVYTEFHFDQLADWMSEQGLDEWADALPSMVDRGFDYKRYGDLQGWLELLDELPDIEAEEVELTSQVALHSSALDPESRAQIEQALRGLVPWRKGPYSLFGIDLDAEWRSDWKWERILPGLDSLDGQLVLDVGCGNGYHLWRMLGAGARRVIGIDPSPRFAIQFQIIKRLMGDYPAHLVPCTIEALPASLNAFDSVFSMGVLYHRRSPFDHLLDLRNVLSSRGQLVLETLVIAGDQTRCLIPADRYAKMRNVWFIPSIGMLSLWLTRLGFQDVRVIDETPTSVDEQRTTDWMQFESLADFLDPCDQSRTIEGYPAPVRATLTARKPAD